MDVQSQQVDMIGIMLSHGLCRLVAPADLRALRVSCRQARDASYAAIKHAELRLPSTLSDTGSLAAAEELAAFHAKLAAPDLEMLVECTGLMPAEDPVVVEEDEDEDEDEEDEEEQQQQQQQRTCLMWMQQRKREVVELRCAAHRFMSAYARGLGAKRKLQAGRMHLRVRVCDTEDIPYDASDADEQEHSAALERHPTHRCVLPASALCVLFQSVRCLTALEVSMSVIDAPPAGKQPAWVYSDPGNSIAGWVIESPESIMAGLGLHHSASLSELRLWGVRGTPELTSALCGLRSLRVLLADWRFEQGTGEGAAAIARLGQALSGLEELGMRVYEVCIVAVEQSVTRFPRVHTLRAPAGPHALASFGIDRRLQQPYRPCFAQVGLPALAALPALRHMHEMWVRVPMLDQCFMLGHSIVPDDAQQLEQRAQHHQQTADRLVAVVQQLAGSAGPWGLAFHFICRPQYVPVSLPLCPGDLAHVRNMRLLYNGISPYMEAGGPLFEEDRSIGHGHVPQLEAAQAAAAQIGQVIYRIGWWAVHMAMQGLLLAAACELEWLELELSFTEAFMLYDDWMHALEWLLLLPLAQRLPDSVHTLTITLGLPHAQERSMMPAPSELMRDEAALLARVAAAAHGLRRICVYRPDTAPGTRYRLPMQDGREVWVEHYGDGAGGCMFYGESPQ